MKLLAVVISAVSFLSAGAAHYDGLDEREPMQSTEHVARPHVGNVPYGENYPDYNWNLVLTNETGTIINQCKSPGLVALAFDDGPWVFTNQLLDLLDQLGVHATFFVTGDNMGKGRIDDCSRPWPSILYRMYESGHQIASHTWTHQNLDHVNHAVQQAEMVNNEIALQNLFGWIPTYTRPPYLECTAKSGCPDLLGNLGYHVITSNIDTKDYLNDGPYQVQKSKDLFDAGISTQSTKNSYIVLAHDTHSQTATNLTAFMIRTAKDRSYKLVTVGECLGDPKANWYRSVPNGKHAFFRSEEDLLQTSQSATSTLAIRAACQASGERRHVVGGSTLLCLRAACMTSVCSSGMWSRCVVALSPPIIAAAGANRVQAVTRNALRGTRTYTTFSVWVVEYSTVSNLGAWLCSAQRASGLQDHTSLLATPCSVNAKVADRHHLTTMRHGLAEFGTER
ncbi:hypothetical protein PCL_08916 [Purpureocillium lilacinum]|uniref:CAZyme family CE4 n=1 Tax=Purpureocillium lilacinum TaxID=33203 RepID=A0A2U3EGS9_PURLI|nr:CAZyme family CE4 [Purpureocillium lilacinum]PWI73640.1 hypothetical protein PCL_08916 [Purpureocillium lilacinum]